MRTKNSLKNLIYAFIGQFIGIIVSFIARIFFIKTLGKEYLGLNGLFTNILTMLSLFELGVGTAINFSLYKPLANKNKEKIKSLMNLYKKAYTIIGIVVFLVGITLIPFLPFFISEMPDIDNITIIYILFVLNTAISYFFSYKRSLLISDQKRYIATIYRYLFYIILNVLQIIILLITKNYYLYLILQIVCTLLENIFISTYANKEYSYLKDKEIASLDADDKQNIKKNIKAMLFHKIGGIAVSATDNVIISKYVGLIYVGIYSNYYLIINALNTIISQIFNSTIASIGNFAVTESKKKLKELFNNTFFINFILYSFTSLCLIIILNDFITLWLSDEYIFDKKIVYIIIASYYLTGMRKAVITFKEALGLYWQDRYKAIIEAIINLVISILLVKKIGIIGVFLGTIISTISTCFYIEPIVLYKYGLNTSSKEYFIKYFKYTIIFLITSVLTCLLTNLVFTKYILLTLVLKIFICIFITAIIYFISFRNQNEFIYLKKLIKKIIKVNQN